MQPKYQFVALKSFPTIKVVIPALNEESSVGLVLNAIPDNVVSEIIVVDNGSKDRTANVVQDLGATILYEPLRGYGNACLKGIEYIRESDEHPDILVFLDADYSDHPEELPKLIQPIIENQADFVIGSRALGNKEDGSMTLPQVFGNRLATFLIRILYGYRFTDLGPFRAIRWDSYEQLEMCDKNYGWTVEMQLKVVKKGLRCVEVPVSYRRRIGHSKVSGTVKGVVMAGYKIIWTIFKYL